MRNILLAYLITGLLIAAFGYTPSGSMLLDCLHSYGVVAWVAVLYILYQLITFVVYAIILWINLLWEEGRNG